MPEHKWHLAHADGRRWHLDDIDDLHLPVGADGIPVDDFAINSHGDLILLCSTYRAWAYADYVTDDMLVVWDD